MKTYLMLFLLFTVVEASAQTVCKQEGVDEMHLYAKVLGGVNYVDNTQLQRNKATYRTGYLIDGSVGFYWRYGLSAEAEYAFRRNGIRRIAFYIEGVSEQGRFQASSYMGNLFWDLPLSWWGCRFWDIRPYVGGGLGYDFQQMHSTNDRVIFDQKWHHLAWQLMAGLSYPVYKHTEISLEYKFHQGGCHFYNHSLGLGLTYHFGFLNRG